ncbi:MAG: glycosyl hydrolase family 28-related protein [Sideroxydans sp.]|nr:glycosyl hydrolase family 28-related protein [Sideroxydans sp.]
MSISSTVRKSGPYSGDGINVSFPFSFKVFAAGDVLVTRTDLALVDTSLTLTTDYTVTLNSNQDSNPGGVVTMLAAPANGFKLTVSSAVPDTQPMVLTNLGGFYPSVLNDMADRVTILIQQIKTTLAGALRLPISTANDVSTDLPPPSPLTTFGWDTTGKRLVAYVLQAGTSLIDLASSSGSALMGTIQSGTGAVARTQASKNSDVVSVKDFGAVGDGVTDDTLAFAAVRSYLSVLGGGTMYVPKGHYIVTSDLVITANNTCILGEGNASLIEFQSSSLKYDAIAKGTNLSGCHISNIQLKGTGTANPVIWTYGQNAMGVVRFVYDKVLISSSVGDGIRMQGTWIFDVAGCTIQACGGKNVNVLLALDGNSSVNAGRWLGGEIQGGSDYGVYAEGCVGLAFYGTTIEGNKGGGVNLANNCRSTSFFGCYFELNSDASAPLATTRDIVHGDVAYAGTKGTGTNLTVDGCIFWKGAGSIADYAIELSRCISVKISGSRFNAYTVAGIHYNPEATNQVTGTYDTCSSNGLVTDAALNANFRAPLSDVITTAAVVYNFGAIATGATATNAFTVASAVAGDFVEAQCSTNLQGCTVSAQCTVAGQIAVSVSNNTGASKTIANTTWRFIVKPRAYFGL